MLIELECLRKSDCCCVEVNLTTLTCWGYYQILDIGVFFFLFGDLFMSFFVEKSYKAFLRNCHYFLSFLYCGLVIDCLYANYYTIALHPAPDIWYYCFVFQRCCISKS